MANPHTTDAKHRSWLIESIQYFRELDFFSQFAHLSHKALADLALDHHGDRLIKALRFYLEPASANMPTPGPPDDYLIALDTERVWPLECYEEGLEDFAALERIMIDWRTISRGAFAPDQLSSHMWIDEDGTGFNGRFFELRFQMDGISHQLLLDTRGFSSYIGTGHYINMLLCATNHLIAESGFVYRVSGYGIVMVDSAEQQLLDDIRADFPFDSKAQERYWGTIDELHHSNGRSFDFIWEDPKRMIYVNDTFAKLFRRLANTSEGILPVQEITEIRWYHKIPHREGIVLNFMLNGEPHQITLYTPELGHPNDMYLLIGQFADVVNEFISKSGYRFVETPAGMVVLTDAEIRRLKSERNWWWWNPLEGSHANL